MVSLISLVSLLFHSFCKHRKEICKVQWILSKGFNCNMWCCLFSNKCPQQISNIFIFRILRWWWSFWSLLRWGRFSADIFYDGGIVESADLYFTEKIVISSIAGNPSRITFLESNLFVLKRFLTSVAVLDTKVLLWIIWQYIFVQFFFQLHFFSLSLFLMLSRLYSELPCFFCQEPSLLLESLLALALP